MNTAPADLLQSVPPIHDIRVPRATNGQKLSVVIPCHNESAGLADLKAATERLRLTLEGQCQLELLLIDDGSTDDTWQQMQILFGQRHDVVLLRHETNRGIAAAIATGVAAARTDIVASLDADCTYDPLVLVPMLRLLTNEVDMVVASPYHPTGGVEGVPAWRIGLSRLASRMYRVVLRNKLHTYTSCVRIYRRSSIIDLPLRNSGFVGVAELLWQLDRSGGTILEHPAVLRVRRTGHSKMRVVGTACAHLRLLVRAASLRPFDRNSRPQRRFACPSERS